MTKSDLHGLQLGGKPSNPERHVQVATPPAFVHSEFGPQGSAVQGFSTEMSVHFKYEMRLSENYFKN